MNAVDYSRYLNRPPSCRYHGSTVTSFNPFSTLQESTPVQYREEQPGAQIHLRETLKTGQIHHQFRLGVAQKKVALFIDDSPSVCHLLGEPLMQLLGHLLKKWVARHHLQGNFYFSSQVGFTWGKQLWNHWANEKEFFRGGRTLVLSDFHGDSPSGAFWQILSAQTDASILKLNHPEPELANGQHVTDINQPDTPPLHWDQHEFISRQKKWREDVQRFLRASSIPTREIQYFEERDVVQQLFLSLTT